MAAALKTAGMPPRDMAVPAAMIGGLQGSGMPVPPGAAGRT